ncbi:MAG: 1,4-dihydroxy-2-naphthoate octaprenyltransferase [Chloroflexi bacterium]|nr:1,4-dihydroxy-2-naphthoate octaprenyltransferase [Chloroflexota bacterium]
MSASAVPTPAAPITKRQAWIHAMRPRVFTAAYAPMGVAAAAALRDGVFDVLLFALSLIGVMLLQTTANLVNEYYDFVRGSDDLKVDGQGMAIKKYGLTPREVGIGAVASLVAGCLIGLFLLSQSGPLLWAIGIGGALVAVIYTAGPFPLAYNGLGELAAGIFMGPLIVVGAYYVMARGQLAPDLVWISLPVGLMVAAILHANNLRDMEADRAANKRTLAVLLGRPAARVEYVVLVGGAYVALAGLIVFGAVPVTTALAALTLPEARALIRIFNTVDDPAMLHPAQGRTARLHGRFGLLMVAGWLVWLLLDAVI